MKKFFTILILLVSVSFVFGQTLYYVDGTNGTDDGSHGAAPGTNAWASIKYAIATVSNPTTATIIINVAAGTYTENDIQINRSFNSLSIVGVSAKTTIVQAHASANTASTGVFNIIGSSGDVTDEIVSIQNLTIKNGVELSGGNNVNSGGGGITNGSGTLSIANCVVSNCTGDYGGGIYNSGPLVMENSTISNNSTVSGDSEGGGLFCSSALGTSQITNCTFSNNSSKWGGGISPRGNMILTNCTIANNTASSGNGDGVWLQSACDIALKNTIIANNGVNAGDYELYRNLNGTITSNGYNIVGRYAGTGVTIASTGDWTDQNYDGTFDLVGGGTSSSLNLSATLADNSTLNGTQTLALSTGSFAIDSGSDTGAPTTDQRGATRSGTTDIGAYEYAGVVPVELTSFTATSTDAGVILNWTTATEVNNYGFEVEASRDLPAQWEVIGFVEGHGNSNSPKEYSFVDNSGATRYRLKQIDTDGAFEYSDVVSVGMELSKEFEMAQNYPNPFNPTTIIAFTLPTNGFVTLKVYNTIGEEVAELLNKNIEAGNHNVVFNASNLPTGAYFYRITADNFSETKKMLLIK